jgi:hypothetical protein
MLVFARRFFALIGVIALMAVSASAADSIKGQVLGGGAPIANSTAVLWEASANAPKKLVETKTNDQGQFDIHTTAASNPDSILHLVATGGEPQIHKGTGANPAIVLLVVLGNKLPEKVT